MRILEECVRCFISSLFMGIFLAKAHCRYIPLIQRFKIIVFSLIYTIVNAFFGTFLGQHRTIHKRHFSEQQQPRKARITLLIDSREHTASSRQAGPVSQKQIC